MPGQLQQHSIFATRCFAPLNMTDSEKKLAKRIERCHALAIEADEIEDFDEEAGAIIGGN